MCGVMIAFSVTLACSQAYIALPDVKTAVSVERCLHSIVEREFDLNPLGFMIVTKTYDLPEPASSVQSSFLRALLSSERTAIMTVGNDQEDIDTRKKLVPANENGHNHEKVDELGYDKKEDVLVQSHLMFIRLSDFYVVIVDGYRMCKNKIRQLIKIPSWNARALMVIYCSKNVTTEKEMLRYPTFILRFLWDFNVMNVILLIHDWKNHSIVNIYSWEPYDPPSRCGEKDQEMENIIKLYDACLNGELVVKNKLFPNKIPKNLMGCPIDILGVIWHPFLNHNGSEDDAGFDRDIINIIAEKLNFSVQLNTQHAQWGERDDVGQWDGMMGALKRGEGEVAIGAVYPDNTIHEDFDSTLSYLQDSYVWIVPRARETPQWENLVILLKPLTWLASLVTLVVVVIVWYCLSQPASETGIKMKTFVPVFLDCWCIYIGASMVSRPITTAFRIYFIFYCLYSMIWCTSYQSKLINVLTSPTYEYQITQTSELLESKLSFGGNEAFRSLFNNSIDAMDDHLFSNYLVLDIHKVLEDVITHRNVSILTSKLYVRYLSATTLHYNDVHGVPMFHSLSSSAFSFPIEMVAVKGFAFLEYFNNYITLLKSNGLMKFFYNNFKILSKKDAARLAREAGVHEERDQALQLDHLQGAFFVLLVGSLAAGGAFLAEILVHRKEDAIGRNLQNLKNRRLKNVPRKLQKNINGFGMRIKRNKYTKGKYIPRYEFIKWTMLYTQSRNKNQTKSTILYK